MPVSSLSLASCFQDVQATYHTWTQPPRRQNPSHQINGINTAQPCILPWLPTSSYNSRNANHQTFLPSRPYHVHHRHPNIGTIDDDQVHRPQGQASAISQEIGIHKPENEKRYRNKEVPSDQSITSKELMTHSSAYITLYPRSNYPTLSIVSTLLVLDSSSLRNHYLIPQDLDSTETPECLGDVRGIGSGTVVLPSCIVVRLTVLWCMRSEIFLAFP
jgi:hypothetical protein